MATYIVIEQHLWMNEHGSGVHYSSDGSQFPRRATALYHGYRTTGTDDFNIGTLDDSGRLVAFGWGDDDFGPDEDGSPFYGHDLVEIASTIGVEPPKVAEHVTGGGP